MQSIKHLEYCSNILQGEMSVANERETIFKQKKLLAADKEFMSECAHEAEKSKMKRNLILTGSGAQNKYQPQNDQNYIRDMHCACVPVSNC